MIHPKLVAHKAIGPWQAIETMALSQEHTSELPWWKLHKRVLFISNHVVTINLGELHNLGGCACQILCVCVTKWDMTPTKNRYDCTNFPVADG